MSCKSDPTHSTPIKLSQNQLLPISWSFDTTDPIRFQHNIAQQHFRHITDDMTLMLPVNRGAMGDAYDIPLSFSEGL